MYITQGAASLVSISQEIIWVRAVTVHVDLCHNPHYFACDSCLATKSKQLFQIEETSVETPVLQLRDFLFWIQRLSEILLFDRFFSVASTVVSIDTNLCPPFSPPFSLICMEIALLEDECRCSERRTFKFRADSPMYSSPQLQVQQ